MTKKLSVWLLATFVLAIAIISPADAQQSKKVPRIGFLYLGASLSSAPLDSFRQGLRDLGYIEGKNIFIEYRYAKGNTDRLPDLATELVKLKLDLLVVGSSQAASAAKQATMTLPIVMASSGDVVSARLVESLAHPGGNLTGMSIYSPEMNGKRLELLKEAFPKVFRVAVLGDPTSQSFSADWNDLNAAGKSLAVKLQSLEISSSNPDFKVAFTVANKGHADAILTLAPPILAAHRNEIVTLTNRYALPAMFHSRDFVDAGGIMSYGPNLADSFKRAAVYVDKILKGAVPSDLPIERPIKFEFVINLKTAKQIGLTIPPNVLARADRVIK
jgi:putative ABC transport system substrate-binding protein